jgi:hypothetical protein
MDQLLTAEELLAGTSVTYDVVIPQTLLGSNAETAGNPRTIKIKPLSMGVFQLIMRGAREEPEMIPVLMVKEGLAEPKLSVAQIKSLPVGLVEFMVDHIRELSGMTEKKKI